MRQSICSLDTPKKTELQSRADQLRVALKDFERTYAAENNGQKPSKDAIKADSTLSQQYKVYNKIRDVLAGRLPAEALDTTRSPKRRTSTSTSTFLASPGKPLHEHTPRARRSHPGQIDPYDAPASASPHRTFLAAIGPTPQRDGQILGIFDMLSYPGSARTSQETPSSRKRKAAALSQENQIDTGRVMTTLQTPTASRFKKMDDLLEHLASDTPISAVATSKHKHSRTPASDSKKFMLSQFFATPSTVRYTNFTQKHNEDLAEPALSTATPLRDNVLRLSPSKVDVQVNIQADATPAYLRRSYSFKDRLLSASKSASHSRTSSFDIVSPSSVRIGPRPRKTAKFVPKPLSQIASDMRRLEDEQHDDDLDALHELEADDLNMINGGVNTDPNQPPFRSWKKKGQKRTTRRANIKPSKMKSAKKPKFIAVEDEVGLTGSADEDENASHEITSVEETQFVTVNHTDPAEISDEELSDPNPRTSKRPRNMENLQSQRGDEDHTRTCHDDDDEKSNNDEAYEEADDFSDYGSDLEDMKSGSVGNSRATGKQKTAAEVGEVPKPAVTGLESKQKKSKKTPGMINPNAQSHMNFRSLKIKNKNSRAQRAGGGGARFGGSGRRG